MHQFIQITLVFHRPYLSHEDSDPNFYFISETSKSLSVHSRSSKQIYRVESFRTNVLKVSSPVGLGSSFEIDSFNLCFKILKVNSPNQF